MKILNHILGDSHSSPTMLPTRSIAPSNFTSETNDTQSIPTKATNVYHSNLPNRMYILDLS